MNINPNESSNEDTIAERFVHYANPAETTFIGACFEFRFGAYGDTIVRVYHKTRHLEDALEIAAEWLLDNYPGQFEHPDYSAAADELGITTWGSNVITDEDESRVIEAAEDDLTYTESGWLASGEWFVNELEGDPLDSPTFERFDIAEAYATYWAEYHTGQFSHGYQRLSAALNLLTNCDLKFESLSDNGKAIYRKLALSDGR